MPSPLILLVEDDRQAREGYAEFLELGGFRVAQAGNAEDALAAAVLTRPDAVVTDIALPGTDGFALAHFLRTESATRTVPVLAMTAYWAADVHERAERAGISSMLLKPCQPQHLIAELHRAIQKPALARPLAHPGPGSSRHSA